jgi:hypothetical protein
VGGYSEKQTPCLESGVPGGIRCIVFYAVVDSDKRPCLLDMKIAEKWGFDAINSIFAIISPILRNENKLRKDVYMGFSGKKMVILAAVLLLVIGAGTAFAADGISLDWRDNTVYISNENSRPYNVTVKITYSANGSSFQTNRTVNVKAGKTESVSIASSAIIERVEVTSASPGL